MVVSSIFLLFKTLIMNNNPLTELLWNIADTIFWYVVIISLVIIVIALVLNHFWLLDKILNLNKFESKKENKFDLVSEWKIFTNTELNFFNELNKLIDNVDYFLFTKVRLVDLVSLKKAEYSVYMKIFNQLSKKHIDFVIVDRYWRIKVLIELDDRYHKKNKAKQNDEFKNELSLYLNIPLIRYNAWNSYNFENLKDILV